MVKGEISLSKIINTVFTSHRSNKYRPVEDSNYWRYRGPLVRTMSMMLRFIHWNKTKSKKLTGIGKFKILSEPTQDAAAVELYTLFIHTEGNPACAELNQTLHKFLDSLLRPQKLSEKAIGCPTDQAIFLASILSKGRVKSEDDSDYRTAAYVAGLCCHLCFGFRGIFSHIIRLLSESQDTFTPYVPRIILPKTGRPRNNSSRASAILMDEVLGIGLSGMELFGDDDQLEATDADEELSDFVSDIEGNDQDQDQAQLNEEPSGDDDISKNGLSSSFTLDTPRLIVLDSDLDFIVASSGDKFSPSVLR